MTTPYRTSRFAWAALPPRLAGELMAELEPAERVVWTGVPRRASVVRRALRDLLIPLAFNGLVLAIVALCSWSAPQAGPLALGLVPLLALGLPLFQAPLGAWHAARQTFYAVTDRRALVFGAHAFVSIDRGDIVAVRVRPFGRSTDGDIALIVRRQARPGTALLGVPDVRSVAQILCAS
jgi:hypothetical protein